MDDQKFVDIHIHTQGQSQPELINQHYNAEICSKTRLFDRTRKLRRATFAVAAVLPRQQHCSNNLAVVFFLMSLPSYFLMSDIGKVRSLRIHLLAPA